MLAYFTLAIALFSMTSLRPTRMLLELDLIARPRDSLRSGNAPVRMRPVGRIRMRKYRATFSRKGKP